MKIDHFARWRKRPLQPQAINAAYRPSGGAVFANPPIREQKTQHGSTVTSETVTRTPAARWDCNKSKLADDVPGREVEAVETEYAARITRWLATNPPSPSGPDNCGHCRQPLGEAGRDGVPHLAGEAGHIWLHHSCWNAFQRRRRLDAERALQAMGVHMARRVEQRLDDGNGLKRQVTEVAEVSDGQRIEAR